MTDPIHLNELDYSKLFPAAADEFPALLDDAHYIDAWILNSIFDSLINTEQYLLDHQANIEAPVGDDIIGDDGSLLVSIPPARYPSYRFAMAWDSNLLEENIKSGETVFGITGTLSGGASIDIVGAVSIVSVDPVAVAPSGLSIPSAPGLSLGVVVV